MKVSTFAFVFATVFSLASGALAQIPVPSGGAGPLGFPAAPTTAQGWSTLSIGSSAGTISTVGELDDAVQLLNAANITTAVGSSGSDPSTANAIARWNSTRQRLQTKPTNVDYLVLMATLRNDTGMDITSFDVSYLFAVDPAGNEQLLGHHAYYSVTGAPGSWAPLPTFTGVTANGTLTTTITPTGWSSGANLYILWADDNADGGTEGGYTIDDFTVSNVSTTVLPVSIAIQNPTNNQHVVKSTSVNVTTTSTGPIVNVDFRVDGGSVAMDNTAPYGFTLDTTPLTIGSHTLQAFASDGVNQTPSAVITFVVDANMPPTIVIDNLVAPTNFLVGTAIPVEATISDDVAVTNVDWFVDNVLVLRRPAPDFSFTYANPTDGNHVIRGEASDNTGQIASSANVVVTVTNPPANFTILVENGSDWRYNSGNLEPVSPGGSPEWYQSAFDDSAWSSGFAELGAGDAEDGYPEQTMIDIGLGQPRYNAIYFRKKFNVTNPAQFPNVVLRLLRDDGGVVYLNGNPVWTNNMAFTDLDPVTGNIAYTNLAAAAAADEGLVYQVLNLPSSVLIAGQNTVAVQIHQNSTNSSDLSFDLMLWGEAATAPVLAITSPTNTQTFVAGVDVPVNVNASTFITNVVLLYDGSPLGNPDDTRPFSFVISNVTVGSHTLVARGRDQFNVQGDSPTVTINVTGNQAPTVTLTNPPTDLTLLVGGLVNLGATAVDADGSIARVEFRDNGTLIATDTTSPYAHTEVDLTAGVHVFTAVAYDNSDQATTSASRTVTVTNPPNVTVLLTNRSSWKYAAITNGNFGTSWENLAFDDSAWNMGQGKFGFGGDGEHTVIGGVGIPSFYFRKVINIPDPSAFGSIIIGLVRDDGAIIHVNGNEVHRERITGADPVPFDTLADSPAVGGADENTFFFSTNASSIFTAGQNIIAVEVHQQSLTSSDAGFDLMLFGTTPGCPNPRIVYNVATGQVTISWTGSGQLYQANSPTGPYTTLASPTSPFTFTPTLGATRFYRVLCN